MSNGDDDIENKLNIGEGRREVSNGQEKYG